MLTVLDAVNVSGRISAMWKVAKVVLISKPEKDLVLPSSYRPITVLSALSKVWEHTFKNLMAERLGLDHFHINQLGFRRRKTTVDALRRVGELVDSSKRRKRICVIAAVDIKNASNTLRWNTIYLEAEGRGMPRKLLCLLGSCVEDRKIAVRNSGGTLKRNVYAGVPHGSMLGPLFWNLVYDDLLMELQYSSYECGCPCRRSGTDT